MSDDGIDPRFSLEALEEEIRALHRFFTSWVRGELSDDPEEIERFRRAHMHPHFSLVMPGGGHIDINALGDVLPDSHASNPDFAADVRAIQRRHCEGPIAVVTYEEWQRNAKTTPTPNNGRLVTGVLRLEGETGRRWVHMHQTWLPPDRIREEEFDF